MSAPIPVAVGYVCAPEGGGLDEQRESVTNYARDEGLDLAQIVTDRFDTFTISQVVQSVKLHNARLVIVPAATRLASVHPQLAHELKPDGATCVVIGGPLPGSEKRSRLTDSLPSRTSPTTTALTGAAPLQALTGTGS